MNKRKHAAVALVLVIALWGATFVVVKEALDSASVFVFLGLRFSLAALALALMYRAKVMGMSRAEVSAGAQIGFFLFAGYALQSSGLLFTTASKSAFITGAAVVLVPVVLFAIWRERVHPGAWWGALAALAGLFFVTMPADGWQGSERVNPGDLLTMGGTLMFALHIIFISRYSGKHSVGALTFVQVATTAVLSLAAIPLFHLASWERVRLDWNAGLIGALLLTGLLCTAVAFSVQVWSQRYLAPSHTGLLLTLEPVFAVITSYVFLGERLSGRVLLGSLLILAGILVAELKGPAPAAPDAPSPVGPPTELTN